MQGSSIGEKVLSLFLLKRINASIQKEMFGNKMHTADFIEHRRARA